MSTYSTPLEILTSRLRQGIQEMGLPLDLGVVTSTANPRFGDYQTNAAMVAAKILQKNPRDLAREIIEHLQVDDCCEAPTIAGAGFINFSLILSL